MTEPRSTPDDEKDPLRRHTAQHAPLSDCPLVPGNAVELLPGGAEAVEAMFDAIAAARDHVHMEYYTFEDVAVGGRRLSDLLIDRVRAGVSVAVVYDAIGSDAAPDELFKRLEEAGARLQEFQPLNPLRRHFAFDANDRDHRKILVVDGQVAFLGGVNMDHVYANPRSAGAPPGDADRSFWLDAAVRIRGPVIAEVQKLFLRRWQALDGGPPPGRHFPALAEHDGATVRVDGSAPREKRQLYYESLCGAVEAARSHILLATGYFVPTRDEWQRLATAAERGVGVDLLLPGYSDVMGAVHAARALYGPLLRAGVRIHEVRDSMLHAKVATVDGAWTAIGSSNLDRRSKLYNDEIDAVVLGRDTAAQVEAMLRGWIAAAETVTLADWQRRSRSEHVGELLARLWKRYM